MGEDEEYIPEEQSDSSSSAEEMDTDVSEKGLVHDITNKNNENSTVSAIQSKSSRKRSSGKDKYQTILSPCACKKKCIKKIKEDERKLMHQEFWKLDSYDERRKWAFGQLTQNKTVTKTVAEVARVKSIHSL